MDIRLPAQLGRPLPPSHGAGLGRRLPGRQYPHSLPWSSDRLAAALGEAPLTDVTLAGYLAGMFAAGKSEASAKLVVAAVRFQARLVGCRPPTGPLVERALRGYARRGEEVSRRGQVQGIRWEQADADAANAGLRGLRDAALVAVMSDGLLRISEAAALDLADLNFEDQALTIRRSKTDQEDAGAVVYTGRPTLERLKAWIQAAGITGGLFRRVGKSGKVGGRLTVRSLRRIIEGRVSGHSLRVGSAQSLATAGALHPQPGRTAGSHRQASLQGVRRIIGRNPAARHLPPCFHPRSGATSGCAIMAVSPFRTESCRQARIAQYKGKPDYA